VCILWRLGERKHNIYLILKLIIEHRRVYRVEKQHMDSSSDNDNDTYLLLLLTQLGQQYNFRDFGLPAAFMHGKLTLRRVLQLLQLRFRRPLPARRPSK
jgi:hypothetical protein